MMAVITKAMGAFLVLMVFGLSYYSPGTGSSVRAIETKAQVEDIRRQLADAEKRLVDGNLSEADRQALITRLKDLQARLEEAGRQLGQLRITLDQRDSVIARLTGDNDKLKLKVAPLEARLETLLAQARELQATLNERDAAIARLTATGKPVSVSLTYDACQGARIGLYVQRFHPQRNVNSPVPQRRPQGPVFQNDTRLIALSKGNIASERWGLANMQTGEELKIYLSFQNGLGGSLTCRAHVMANTARDFRTYSADVSENGLAYYVGHLRYMGDQTEELEMIPVSRSEVGKAFEEAKASPCEGLQCGIGSIEAKPFIAEAVVQRFQYEIAPVANAEPPDQFEVLSKARQAVLADLGKAMANGEMKFNDVERWVAFLRRDMQDTQQAGVPPADPATLESWRAAIIAHRLPASVADLFVRQAQSGWPDRLVARARLEEYGILKPSIVPVPSIPVPKAGASIPASQDIGP